jgi:hypothetical protein
MRMEEGECDTTTLYNPGKLETSEDPGQVDCSEEVKIRKNRNVSKEREKSERNGNVRKRKGNVRKMNFKKNLQKKLKLYRTLKLIRLQEKSRIRLVDSTYESFCKVGSGIIPYGIVWE